MLGPAALNGSNKNAATMMEFFMNGSSVMMRDG
jgi:hypothetical protein